MLLPRWAAQLAVGLVLVAGELRKLRVLPNGAPLDGEGAFAVEVDSWERLRTKVEGHFGPSLWHDPKKDWYLTDVNGTEMKSWEDVLALPGPGPILHAVPSGMLFQWGPRKVGERFPVRLSDREGVEVETVASHPRIFLIHNLMSMEEATGLIERSLDRTGEYALQASGVGFKTSGPRSVQSLRTSASAFDSESEVSKRIIARAFEVTRSPHMESMADGLQILQYKEGQAYISHRDWFPVGSGTSAQNFNTQSPGGSNRWATVFLYLWSPPSGGFTVFPEAKLDPLVQDSAHVSSGRDKAAADTAMRRARSYYNKSAWEIKLMEQCYSRLAVKPVQLGAALFYHQDPMSGELLPQAEHGACPSLTGTKWGANLWIWNTARHLTDGKAAEPCNALFRNDEAHALDLAWSTDDGAKWVFFGTIAPNHHLTSNTFGGHWWRFTTQGTQNEVRRYTIPLGTAAAEFSSKSEQWKRPKGMPNNGPQVPNEEQDDVDAEEL